MRVFGYVRLSRLDRDSTSPQRQRQIIEQLCAARGWELVETFEDLDVSGARQSRPGLDAMLSRLGEVDVVATWKLDRLARSLSHLLKLAETLQEAGVQMVTSDGEVDTTTAAGVAFYQMRGVFAEFERNTVSDRSRSMHAFLRAAGRVQSRVPFGWRKGADGRLEPVEEEQAALQDMAERTVAGESLRELARERGVAHTTVRYWLRSERVLAALPPGLSGDLRATLQAKSDGFRPATRSLLGGIAVCAVCDGPLKRSVRGGRAVYGCRDKGHVYVDLDWLDFLVTAALFGMVGSREVVPAPRRRRPAADLAGVEARLERLEVDYYERGLVSEASFLRRREALMRRIAESTQPDEQPPPDVDPEAWDDLPMAGKRGALRGWVSHVQVAPVAPGQPRGQHDPDRVYIQPRDEEAFRRAVRRRFVVTEHPLRGQS